MTNPPRPLDEQIAAVKCKTICRSFNTLDKARRWIESKKVDLRLNSIDVGQAETSPDRLRSPTATLDSTIASQFTMSDVSEPLDSEMELETPPEEPSEELILSEQQREVVELCESGQSIFFTGSAGTGKSVTLREIIRRLKAQHEDKVYVTASTGIAAINIGGTTLHSWAGIRHGKENAEVLEKKMSKKSKARWNSARVLIIDEISMIDGRLFDKLEYLGRKIRGTGRPFGGIQLILSGDFFQLPPVPEKSSVGQSIPSKFAFEADGWNECVNRMIVLQTVFRQKESDFIAVLNMMRHGNLDPLSDAIFRSLSRDLVYEDGIEPTQLFPLRYQVEAANKSKLDALQTEELIFRSYDFPGYDMYGRAITPTRATEILEQSMAPRKLRLRVGAQVMLVKNMSDYNLVNGSIGIVTGFEAMGQSHSVITTDERPEAYVQDIMHRSKGEERFEITQTQELDPKKPDDEQNHLPISTPRWPVVRFTNGREMQCIPASFEVVNAFGRMEATRHQVPLILSWALSIHKSQGQTLERVKVDLQGIFEKGQAYVALSRATSLGGLQVLNYRPDKIQAHPRVIAWSETFDEMRPPPIEQSKIETEYPDSDEELWNQFN